eukprot:1161026-Pelagomonas_calceolata.AAC.1
MSCRRPGSEPGPCTWVRPTEEAVTASRSALPMASIAPAAVAIIRRGGSWGRSRLNKTVTAQGAVTCGRALSHLDSHQQASSQLTLMGAGLQMPTNVRIHVVEKAGVQQRKQTVAAHGIVTCMSHQQIPWDSVLPYLATDRQARGQQCCMPTHVRRCYCVWAVLKAHVLAGIAHAVVEFFLLRPMLT